MKSYMDANLKIKKKRLTCDDLDIKYIDICRKEKFLFKILTSKWTLQSLDR